MARTTEDACDKLGSIKLTNVWNRWWLVLDPIIEDEGANRKMEAKRGKIFCAPPEEAKVTEDVIEEEEMEANWIDAADAYLGGALC